MNAALQLIHLAGAIMNATPRFIYFAGAIMNVIIPNAIIISHVPHGN
jgi:hypothetical protein